MPPKDHTLALWRPNRQTQTTIHDGASLAGDLAGAGNDAESGTGVGVGGGPVGTAVDGVVGGVPGEVVGIAEPTAVDAPRTRP
ncbi:hypothetical protein AB0L14_21280 [Streptomyces sp. NPDC052727]|uniref:hypothetical protein n=1 Tax=Streptomyces sp. NPDC052727 TaxID=3154854 RepID=UPI003431363A